MTEKKNGSKQNTPIILDVLPQIEERIRFFKDIIQKTIIHVNKNKILDILGVGDVTACIEKIEDISKKIEQTRIDINLSTEQLINNLQLINNEVSGLLRNYGTDNLEDLLIICFGNNNITSDETALEKFELLKKYFHPISYKVISKKEEQKNQYDTYDEKLLNFSCSDVSTTYKQFHIKVYGIKLYVHSVTLKKCILITGVLDDIIIDFLNNKYITNKIKMVRDIVPDSPDFKSDVFDKFISSLTLKDFLIYDNQHEIYSKFSEIRAQYISIKQKQTLHAVKDFTIDDIYNKRNTLIGLLIHSSSYENQYLAYLLYDLLSNDVNGSVDSKEQTILFDSFPWTIKQSFKQAIKKTLQYTNDLSNFDINKIPLEQQICLLNASDTIKEKAMMKLKEIKAKPEDSGSKARQYLDGLLKIPFGVYKREPVLNIMNNVRNKFKEMYKKYNIDKIFPEIKEKHTYTNVEILKYIKTIQGNNGTTNKTQQLEKIKEYLLVGDRDKLILNNKILDKILKKYNKQRSKFYHLNKEGLLERSINIIDYFIEEGEGENENIINDIIVEFNSLENVNPMLTKVEITNDIKQINSNMKEISNYMIEVKATLDKAVYGHDKAKTQIERIIGQWINGEQDGYCFGFEGPPGCGKTSLAKRGISNCLKDANGNSRPFAMIQMGGDSNGSTLHGHNYTYVGSTWGSIVQILIDNKCMNPIIFIDEVDKISRTEHGKEIVGILTHLLDSTQNDCFQDKYFTGIDLDLSKALFILSYNDVEAIDKILLDRIHRIKFSNISLEDKLIICNTHILPDIYKKIGLEDMINFKEGVLKFIIDEYTCEAGVRKLKEILFEIIGEINLDILKNNHKEYELPIQISIDDIKTKYFKDKREIKHTKIHTESRIGVINGLWANALGNGGVIPIQVSWRPSKQFLSLHLTGMQGDVMKESMNVALTLAWDLTNYLDKELIRKKFGDKNNYGIHIHCPEGATPKDGPSAGTAITTAIYSILNERKIKYNIAITGEICLNGNVTEIGGLDLKILGAIKAGVKEILFPVENMKDYNTFVEKYKNSSLLEDIIFHPVNTIKEVFELVFEE